MSTRWLILMIIVGVRWLKLLARHVFSRYHSPPIRMWVARFNFELRISPCNPFSIPQVFSFRFTFRYKEARSPHGLSFRPLLPLGKPYTARNHFSILQITLSGLVDFNSLYILPPGFPKHASFSGLIFSSPWSPDDSRLRGFGVSCGLCKALEFRNFSSHIWLMHRVELDIFVWIRRINLCTC